MRAEIHVNAQWDAEAGVWVATSDDVPGLVAEAENHEALIQKLNYLIPELMLLNGVKRRGSTSIPYMLHQESLYFAQA